eukprot:g3346.t1
MHSGLDRATLRAIWNIGAEGKPDLDGARFYVVLRLIAYCQLQVRSGTGATLSADIVPTIGSINLPLVYLGGYVQVPESAVECFWRLRTQYCVSIFQNLAQSTDPNAILNGATIVGFFRSSGLSNDLLRDVWSLSVSPGAKTMRLDAFIRAIDLVQKGQQGQDIRDASISLTLGLPRFDGVQIPDIVATALKKAQQDVEGAVTASSNSGTKNDEGALSDRNGTDKRDAGVVSSVTAKNPDTVESDSPSTTDLPATNIADEVNNGAPEDDASWGDFSAGAMADIRMNFAIARRNRSILDEYDGRCRHLR